MEDSLNSIKNFLSFENIKLANLKPSLRKSTEYLLYPVRFFSCMPFLILSSNLILNYYLNAKKESKNIELSAEIKENTNISNIINNHHAPKTYNFNTIDDLNSSSKNSLSSPLSTLIQVCCDLHELENEKPQQDKEKFDEKRKETYIDTSSSINHNNKINTNANKSAEINLNLRVNCDTTQTNNKSNEYKIYKIKNLYENSSQCLCYQQNSRSIEERIKEESNKGLNFFIF